METNFNLGSLRVVKPHLEEYLQKCIENIGKNIQIIGNEKKQPDDYESIDFLNKLSKTLDIIGLRGIAKIFHLCEESLIYVKSGKSTLDSSLEILNKTKEITEKTRIYLNKIIDSGFDQPTKLFNDYKTLAELIEEKVSIKDLFFPKLQLKETFNQAIQKDLRFGIFLNENIKKYLKNKLSESNENLKTLISEFSEKIKGGSFEYQSEINNIHNLCQKIFDELDFLQKIKINKNNYIFFGLSKLYVCCLSPKFNSNISEYSKEHNKHIINVLQNMIEVVENFSLFLEHSSNGDKTASFLIRDNYIQDLLFEMKIIESNNELTNMPIFKNTEEFFDINYYLNQINEASAFIEFNDTDNLLSEEIKSIYSNIKYLSEQAINDVENNNKMFVQIESQLSDLTKYLVDYEVIKNLANEIKSFSERNNSNYDNSSFKQEFSLGIILLEHGINNHINETVDPRNSTKFKEQVELQIERLQSLNPQDENLAIPQIFNDNGLAKVFEEYNKKLKNIEDSLDYFLKNNGENIEEIVTLPKVLWDIKGIFLSIEKQEALKIIDFIITPWSEIIEKNSFDVNMVDLQQSVEFLGGISLLVKAYSEGNILEGDEIYENIVAKFHKTKFIDENEKIENAFLVESNIEDNFENLNKEDESTEINFSGESQMNISDKEDKIITSLSDGDWPLLKELETTRFALKNKKKKESIIENTEEVIENITKEVDLESSFKEQDLISNNVNNVEIVSVDSTEKDEVAEENSFINEINSNEEEYQISWVSDSTNDPELAEIFLLEAQEVFENLEKEFVVLNNDISNKDALTNIRRYFHTLKGSGRMVGLKYMGEVAWMIEQTLNRCLSDELTFNQDLLDMTIEIKEKFQEWVGDLQINNLVNLDIVHIKNKLLPLNNSLQNSFELSNNIVEYENSIKESIVEETVTTNNSSDKISLDENIIFDEPTITQEETEIISTESTSSSEHEFIVIDSVEISSQEFLDFNKKSEELINSLKEVVNMSFEEPILLGDNFVIMAKDLGYVSALVGLSKITKLANHIESVAVTANNLNIGLSQASLNKLRHVVDNLEVFKSAEASDHVAFYESLKEILVDLEKEILEFEKINEIEENILEEEIDMEKLAQMKMELLEEMNAILEEKNSLLKTVLEKLENSQQENQDLVQKLSNLEENFENFKTNQEQKEKMFVKALEVNRNDIKVLVDLIKKM